MQTTTTPMTRRQKELLAREFGAPPYDTGDLYNDPAAKATRDPYTHPYQAQALLAFAERFISHARDSLILESLERVREDRR